MANVCDKFRHNFKKTFIENIVMMFGNRSMDKWFVSIGKPLPWISAADEVDSFPPAAQDNDLTETDFWQNAIGP